MKQRLVGRCYSGVHRVAHLYVADESKVVLREFAYVEGDGGREMDFSFAPHLVDGPTAVKWLRRLHLDHPAGGELP